MKFRLTSDQHGSPIKLAAEGKYLNVKGVCLALGICRKTFDLRHRKFMELPRILPGRRGYWWSATEVRRRGKDYGLIDTSR